MRRLGESLIHPQTDTAAWTGRQTYAEEALKTSIRCSLPKILADAVHLQDWAVLAKEQAISGNWANLEVAVQKTYRLVADFGSSVVFTGLSDRHRTTKRHLH